MNPLLPLFVKIWINFSIVNCSTNQEKWIRPQEFCIIPTVRIETVTGSCPTHTMRIRMGFPLQLANLGLTHAGRIFSLPTIRRDYDPLVFLDNFPFFGNIGDINPNQVHSIKIFRSAKGASLFGKQALNGVIIITTKKIHRKDSINGRVGLPEILIDDPIPGPVQLNWSIKTDSSNILKRLLDTHMGHFKTGTVEPRPLEGRSFSINGIIEKPPLVIINFSPYRGGLKKIKKIASLKIIKDTDATFLKGGSNGAVVIFTKKYQRKLLRKRNQQSK
jgi:hypothetical protein